MEDSDRPESARPGWLEENGCITVVLPSGERFPTAAKTSGLFHSEFRTHFVPVGPGITDERIEEMSAGTNTAACGFVQTERRLLEKSKVGVFFSATFCPDCLVAVYGMRDAAGKNPACVPLIERLRPLSKGVGVQYGVVE